MHCNILQVQTPQQTCILTELLSYNWNPNNTLNQTDNACRIKGNWNTWNSGILNLI